MWDTQYFRLVNDVDLQARSAKLHLFCYCDIVGRHCNLKYKNGKFGGNGDHTSDTAVAHMKAYKSVKDCLQLALVNQTLRWWSPNPNNRGYKLLTHLLDNPQVFVRVVFSKVNARN